MIFFCHNFIKTQNTNDKKTVLLLNNINNCLKFSTIAHFIISFNQFSPCRQLLFVPTRYMYWLFSFKQVCNTHTFLRLLRLHVLCFVLRTSKNKSNAAISIFYILHQEESYKNILKPYKVMSNKKHDSIINLICLHVLFIGYANRPFSNCQSCSFITVHGQF